MIHAEEKRNEGEPTRMIYLNLAGQVQERDDLWRNATYECKSCTGRQDLVQGLWKGVVFRFQCESHDELRRDATDEHEF